MPSQNSSKVILDLCGGSGSWSFPYKEAGYDVRVIDPKVSATFGDVRLMTYKSLKSFNAHGILAAPPCQHLAASGAVHWLAKGDNALYNALSVVDACLRIIRLVSPAWWALENPVGRLKSYIGPPTFSFDPCDFGDHYTKRTYLWGDFKPLKKNRVEPYNGSITNLEPSSIAQSAIRAETPAGFAYAFFEANP